MNKTSEGSKDQVGQGNNYLRIFTQLDSILGCSPASAPSNVVSTVPGPSTTQESSSCLEVD